MNPEEEINRRIVKEILSQVFFIDEDEIDDEDTFFEQGLLSSRNYYELIVEIESGFNTKIDIENVSTDNFISVNRICNYLKKDVLAKHGEN